MNLTIRDLHEAGVHFGHQIKRWNPKSRPFVYDHRHGISIIDLEKTHAFLIDACKYLEEAVASGKDVLLVGTKKQAQEIIREAASATGMPFCASRWMGGTLTNFVTIKKSLEKYKHYLEMDSDGSLDKLHNKEASAIRREMGRMYRNFEGLKEIEKPPAALLVIDVKTELIAVTEAARLNIPVVGIVDTNSDPTNVTYPIPANDDAVKSIRILMDVVVEAIQNGMAKREVAVPLQKEIKPIIRDDIHDVEPEVTISADINMEDADRRRVYSRDEPAPAAQVEAPKKAAPPTEAAKPAEEAKAPETPKKEAPPAEETPAAEEAPAAKEAAPAKEEKKAK